MTQFLPDPYRERLPRTYDVEVQVKRWAIKKPFTRRNLWMDGLPIGCWLFCSLIDILKLIMEYTSTSWVMLGVHLLCVLAWSVSLGYKLERRTVTETKQITE